MFGTMKSGAKAYANVGVETGVMSASPHKLIVMLFEGAETALNAALGQMKSGDVPAKGRSISHAIEIVQNGLRASLDRTSGGEIAANLDSLYEYMIGRLLEANLKNSAAHIEEVLKLLGELRSAWQAIDPATPAAAAPAAIAPAAARPAAAPYDALAPRPTSFASA